MFLVEHSINSPSFYQYYFEQNLAILLAYESFPSVFDYFEKSKLIRDHKPWDDERDSYNPEIIPNWLIEDYMLNEN